MSSSGRPRRLIAVAEVHVPYEAISACLDHRNCINEDVDIVAPVEIVRDREPRLSATLKIYVRGFTAFLKIETYECSRRLNFDISVNKRNIEPLLPPAPKPPATSMFVFSSSISGAVVAPTRCLLTGGRSDFLYDTRSEVFNGETVKLSTLDLSSVRCFTVTLKMVDLSAEPPVPALARELNEARLRGDPQCDACLCVEGAELPAHRLVLATQSQVFAKMFEGSFKEARDGCVLLKDTTRGAAEAFLEYLYTETLPASSGGLELELLDMAERYAVDGLKHECRLRLWSVGWARALDLLRTANPLVAEMRDRFARIVMRAFEDSRDDVSKSSEWLEFQAAKPLAAMLLMAATPNQASAFSMC